jgi:hypothetical protein
MSASSFFVNAFRTVGKRETKARHRITVGSFEAVIAGTPSHGRARISSP